VVILALVIGAFGITTAFAQENEYERWLREHEQEYQDYLDEQDAAFLSFLKQEWVEVEVGAPHLSPLDDKPLSIPVANRPDEADPPEVHIPLEDITPGDQQSEDEEANNEQAEDQQSGRKESGIVAPETSDGEDPLSDPLSVDLSDRSTPPTPLRSSDQPPGDQPDGQASSTNGNESFSTEESNSGDPVQGASPVEADREGIRRASVEVFGTPVAMGYTSAMAPQLEGAISEANIRSYWEDFIQSQPDSAVRHLLKQKRERSLGDWGYYLALRDLSEILYPAAQRTKRTASTATLWMWGMLVQSGYRARVGYNDAGETFLMLPANERLFDHPQLRVGEQRYYIVTPEERTGFGSLRTYKGEHPAADRVFSFDLKNVPKLEGATETRSLTFDYDGTNHTVTVETRPVALDYLAAYPNVELPVLFRAGMSGATHSSVVDDLRPLVDDRSEVEAINLLLRFVQTAFEYKVDQDSFGEERFLFPEETLALPYSDCEDRSVLFAYLVRHVLGLQTVALSYPRHISVAVRLEESDPETVGGYQVEVDGDTYVMADPTYVNADVGMAMSFVRGENPEIVSVQTMP